MIVVRRNAVCRRGDEHGVRRLGKVLRAEIGRGIAGHFKHNMSLLVFTKGIRIEGICQYPRCLLKRAKRDNIKAVCRSRRQMTQGVGN